LDSRKESQASVAAGPAPIVARGSRIERWAPASGAIFVGFIVAAIIVLATSLDPGDKLPKMTRHFASDDHRAASSATLILVGLAAIAFLWFLADLTASARAISSDMLSFLVPVAGVVFIGSLAAGAATWVAPLYNINHAELNGADPKTAATSYILLSSVGFGLFVLAGISGALLMGAAATTAYRGGLLPRWAAVTTIVGAIVAAIGTPIFFVPLLLVFIWALVASIRRTILVRRSVLPLRA
jgi:hypothetical protein